MNYSDALNYIYSFTDQAAPHAQTQAPDKYNLERMYRLLDLLGNPHRKFPSVHITGTKGKGSTSAIVESGLRAAGHRTGLYTSPHLHTFRERIRIGDEMIPANDLIAVVEKLKPFIAQIPGITTFEVITAIAFDYFAERHTDFAVLEVGLGGRLDATNVVLPRVSVITSISYDHTAILGDTLAQIAFEKAGIIKPQTPVILSPQLDEAREVIETVARERNAPLTLISPELEFQVAGSKFQVKPLSHDSDTQTFLLASPNLKPETFNLKLLGQHQLTNATTALAALFVLREQGIAIPNAVIRAGLANVEWHGRFEILAREPFIVIDGAHNADSALQLVTALREYFPSARLHFVFGASSDKDIAGMFDELLPVAASLTLTRSGNARAADPERLHELVGQRKIETHIAPNLATALREVYQRANRNDVICVTGSLFVVAEAREIILAERGIALERD